ncbi:class F sortase [Nocardioides sp. 1609]|uniref:class F sortase n=1 Tax=Nocardioides sp. 1609 TaxID=2508327 RepID=UPI00106FC0C0|nr:class F sortase [Nocardioides sp. 1609]
MPAPSPTGATPRRSRKAAWRLSRDVVPARAAAAAALALVLAGCGAPDADRPAAGADTPAATGAPAAAPDGKAPPAATAPRVGSSTPEPPVAIRLPDGTSMPVLEAGTTSDGLLDVPPDVRAAGWWPGGSRVGDPFGSTLVAAHVDSRAQGLGPFASLLQVQRGDTVRLRSRRLEQVFRVTSLRLVPRSSFERRPRLHSPRGTRRLVLVTCAPPYDTTRGGYQNLAVVSAVPVAGATGRRGR